MPAPPPLSPDERILRAQAAAFRGSRPTAPGLFNGPPNVRNLNFGVDPEELKRARWSAVLTGLGAGLLGGRNWGEGLAGGVTLANQGALQASQDARRDALTDFEMQKAQREEEDRQRRKGAVDRLTQGVDDPNKRAFLEAYPDAGANLIGKSMFPEPATPTSSLAKLKADLDAGFITPEQYNAAMRKETYIAPPQPRQPTEMETWDAWLKSDDPQKRRAAEVHFKLVPEAGQSSGPFAGTAMDAQANNIVYAYETKKAGGGQTTPDEDFAYRLAKNHLESVKIQTTPAGEVYSVQPGPLPTMASPPAGREQPGPRVERLNLGDPEQLKKTRTTVDRNKQAVASLEALLDKFGEGPLLSVTNRGGAALLEQAYNNLMLEAKEAYNLGVLNGPDFEILTTTLTPPTSWKAGLLSKEELKAQLTEYRAKLDGLLATATQQYAPPTQGQPQPIQEWERGPDGRLRPKK